MGYFHWTDEETYKEITHKGNLYERVMSFIFDIDPEDLVPGSGNAYYGEGVYFTDYGPDYARSTIAGKCFGHSQSQDQVECYFEIEFHGNTSIEKVEDHVWLLSPKSTAQQDVVDHGYHPDFEPDDDDDDDDDDDCPSCNKCGDSDDVSDPGGDYYWCSHCGHDIDSDGDCVTSDCSTCDDDDDDDDDDSESCPWCGDEAFLCTQDDDYEGQRIYTCCSVYFDEDGDLWPADNPMGEGLCRSCGTNEHADDCSKELCGGCCDGDCGCDRHE